MNHNQMILIRAAAGDPDAKAEAVEIVLRGIQIYIRNDGDLPLDRCVGLPPQSARTKFKQIRRDYWLAMARQQIPADQKKTPADQLAHEIKTFLTCVWPAWRDRSEAPAEASELRRCLFMAARETAGRLPDSSKHLKRVIGDIEAGAYSPSPWSDLIMKTDMAIDRDCAIEYAHSPALQDEFGTLAAYQAYRRAEHHGRVLRPRPDPGTDMNLAIHVPE
jgi:hypothetical protein